MEKQPEPQPLTRRQVAAAGQALAEYALILALVALAFGFALAATAPAIGNVFDRAIDDAVRQTQVGEIPDNDEFWATITAMPTAGVGGVLPTNTFAPPTAVPTAGPSPTPSQTFTPSPTEPTATPTLTPTATDRFDFAPKYDSIDNPEWWRADYNANLGTFRWNASFWNNTDLSGNADAILNLDDIDFIGTNTSPWVDGINAENFSARFTRKLRVETPTQIQISALVDDGLRVYVNDVLLINQWKGQSATWYSTTVDLPANSADPESDDYTHEVKIEYYQGTVDSRLKVLVAGSSANPDDGNIAGGGNFSCNWGVNSDLNGNDANTEVNMWDEYLGGSLPQDSRCYLEFRGAVVIDHDDPDMAAPQMSFWNLWDFGAGNEGWLELAEYVPLEDAGGEMVIPMELDRGAVTWHKVDLHDANRNYNWTRQVIDLNTIQNGTGTSIFDFSDPNAITRIAFRYVIEREGGSAPRWNIDDILFHGKPERTFTMGGLDAFWDLNTGSQSDDFVTTGGTANSGVISGWGMVSNHKSGPSGMSFHDSVGPLDATDGVGDAVGSSKYTDYKRIQSAPNDSNEENLRVHALEFDGWIDLENVLMPDFQGNTGDPVMAFQHGFHVGKYTALLVQYSTDPIDRGADPDDPDMATWTTFPDGEIRPISKTDKANNIAFNEQIISLKRSDLPGSPSRIRVRFALMVRSGGDRLDGWWIDNIRLGRAEPPRWIDYPYDDDAQGAETKQWIFNGQWGQTEERGHPTVAQVESYIPRSYASSPFGNYDDTRETAMVLKYPLDMRNDTTGKNIFDPDGQTFNSGGAVNNPWLSFMFTARLADQGDDFFVDWKLADEPEDAWRTVWYYESGSGYDAYSDNSRWRDNWGWERAEIDLRTIMAHSVYNSNDAGDGIDDDRDDDIVLRIRMRADGGGNSDGIYIDDIEIAEYDRTEWALWPSNENRDSLFDGLTVGTGDGVNFRLDPDVSSIEAGWWELVHTGADWDAVSYAHVNAPAGTMAFHSSPTGAQAHWEAGNSDRYAPHYSIDQTEAISHYKNPQSDIDAWYVLEMDTIIDLRAVDRADIPRLTFWQMWMTYTGEYVNVQVSREMTGTQAQIDANLVDRCTDREGGELQELPPGADVPQCYEQVRGWSQWETVWSWRLNSGEDRFNGAWQQKRIDLSDYAATIDYGDPSNSEPGDRIKIRFVLDALDNSNNNDGWYVDNITLDYGWPPYDTHKIADGVFDDRARNMINWETEGQWGLSPVIYKGTGGGPISLGIWNVDWWYCAYNECRNIGRDEGTTRRFEEGAKILLDEPGQVRLNNPSRNQCHTVASNVVMNNKPDCNNWNPGSKPSDYFIGQYWLDTPIVGTQGFTPGPRSFVARSDDGVRLKVEELDADGNPISAGGWVINDWVPRAPTTSVGGFNFVSGKRYRVTLQYFEQTGGATLSLTVTDGRYSFTDSPKLTAFGDDNPPVGYGNSSLILRNALDLTGLGENEYVLLEYETVYKSERGYSYLEISTDGGFSWTRNRLRDDVRDAGNNVIIPGSSFSGTQFGRDQDTLSKVAQNGWQLRVNNLTAYKDEFVLLRFRYDRRQKYGNPDFCARKDDCKLKNGEITSSGYFDGWWIATVRVAAFGG